MSNTIEKDRGVALGMLKFIGTGVTVISATISILSFISKARSLEPTYVYTIPTTMLSGPTHTHTHAPVPESSILPTNINYCYYNGSVISTEHHNSTDELIITAQFINAGPAPATAELQLLINGKKAESKTATLIPGEVGSIFITIPPDRSRDVNPIAIVLPISPLSPLSQTIPGRKSYAY